MKYYEVVESEVYQYQGENHFKGTFKKSDIGERYEGLEAENDRLNKLFLALGSIVEAGDSQGAINILKKELTRRDR